jgi:hypothetical protein
MRFSAEREAQIGRLVAAANERARAARVPVTVTASSLVHQWVIEGLERDIAQLDAPAKRKR